MQMIDKIDLKYTSQPHYSDGGIDTMDLIEAKLTDEMYIGLVIGDVIRYATRYINTKQDKDLEKALTMLAWGVNRIRKDTTSE